MMNYFFTAKCALKHHTKLSINPEQKVLHHRQFSFIIFLLENTFRSLNQATSKRSKYHRTVKTTSPCIQTKGKSRDLYSGVYRTAIIGTCASLLGPHGVIWYTCFLRVVFFFSICRTWWWLTLSLLGYWNLISFRIFSDLPDSVRHYCLVGICLGENPWVNILELLTPHSHTHLT